MWPVFLKTRERAQYKGKAYDLKIFREFLESCDEKREVAGIFSHKEKKNLWALICQSLLLKYRLLSLRKYLQISVLNDKAFSELQGILKFLFLY